MFWVKQFFVLILASIGVSFLVLTVLPPSLDQSLYLDGTVWASVIAFSLDSFLLRDYSKDLILIPGKGFLRKCPICRKTFAQSTSMKRHIQATHRKNSAAACPVCGKICKNKYTMWVHRSKKHRTIAGSSASAASITVVPGDESGDETERPASDSDRHFHHTPLQEIHVASNNM